MTMSRMRDATKLKAAIWAALLFLSLGSFGCAAVRADEISRERAIQIAREHVSFEPQSVEAEKLEEDDRPIWRVTFRRPTGPHPMGGIMIVDIDRRTGEVVGLAQG